MIKNIAVHILKFSVDGIFYYEPPPPFNTVILIMTILYVGIQPVIVIERKESWGQTL